MKTNECPQCGAPVESSATRCGYCKVDFSIHHNERGKVAPITSKDINAAINAEEEMEKERIRRREVEEKKVAEMEKERIRRREVEEKKAAEMEKERIRKIKEKKEQVGVVVCGAIGISIVLVLVKFRLDLSWVQFAWLWGIFGILYFYLINVWKK